MPLAVAGNAPQVAKQHRDHRFPRSQHQGWILHGQGLQHHRGKELAERGVLTFQQPHVPQRIQRAATSSANFTSSRRSLGSDVPARLGELTSKRPARYSIQPGHHLLAMGVQKAQSTFSISVKRWLLSRLTPRHTCSTLCRSRRASRISPSLGWNSAPASSRWSQCKTSTRRRTVPIFVSAKMGLSLADGVSAPGWAPHAHHRGRVGPGNSRQDHAHQPHEQLVLGVRPGKGLGQPGQHFDAVVGIAKLDLPQELRTVRVLLHWLRASAGYVEPLHGQGKTRLADDKMLPRQNRELRRIVAAEIERIGGPRQLFHAQLFPQAMQLGMGPRNVQIPRHRPHARAAAQDHRLVVGQRPSPALLRFDALSDQVGHGGKGKG